MCVYKSINQKSSTTINLSSDTDFAVAYQTPLRSPASTLSRTSSRVSFHDYDDVDAYNSHQRALTFPQHSNQNDDHFDIVAATEKRKKMRNKTLLYAGLACVTTVAASNNIYQSTKAHMGRRYEIQRGEMDVDQATKLRKKGFMTDLFSAGVGAVCVNNAFNGWKKYEALKKEEKKEDEMLKKKRRARKEEEEYFSSMR